MFETIKVSVITPTYNDEKYIRQTINSVLSQTHVNLELIIIDDCSSDDTVNIVKSFHDKRIVLIENGKNQGAAYSRNIGIKLSSGDYIAFLDGDDIWENKKLENQIQFMEDNNYFFTATKYSLIDDDGKKTGVFVSAPEIITNKMLRKVSYIGCLTVMFKKSIYPNLAIPEDIKKRNDYALWLKLSERTDCYFLNQNLAYYRKRNNSISSGSKIKLFKYHIALYKSLYSYSSLKSFFMASRNVFYYIFKKKKYIEKENK